MALEIGDKVPAFKGQTATCVISTKDFAGSNVVLYFYPRDNTPGCTAEACDFRDNLSKFKKVKATIYGVSRDSLKSHDNFAGKYDLPFTLISDEDGSVCKAFGAWVEKSMYGKKYMGIDRATFLIDKKGIVRHIWRKVKVKGHVDEVLEKASELK